MMWHPYDRCMALTSAYILLAAACVPRPSLALLMCAQTAASMGHWTWYEHTVLHRVDVALSTLAFVWNAAVLAHVPFNPYVVRAWTCAGIAVLLFATRKGWRERAMVAHRPCYVVPHAAFRFFAFWFVVSVHGQPWSWWWSAAYWCTVAVTAL